MWALAQRGQQLWAREQRALDKSPYGPLIPPHIHMFAPKHNFFCVCAQLVSLSPVDMHSTQDYHLCHCSRHLT
jgi:hypothetical protein